jgi:hypothetical protein
MTSHWGAILSTASQFGTNPMEKYKRRNIEEIKLVEFKFCSCFFPIERL